MCIKSTFSIFALPKGTSTEEDSPGALPVTGLTTRYKVKIKHLLGRRLQKSSPHLPVQHSPSWVKHQEAAAGWEVLSSTIIIYCILMFALQEDLCAERIQRIWSGSMTLEGFLCLPQL